MVKGRAKNRRINNFGYGGFSILLFPIFSICRCYSFSNVLRCCRFSTIALIRSSFFYPLIKSFRLILAPSLVLSLFLLNSSVHRSCFYFHITQIFLLQFSIGAASTAAVAVGCYSRYIFFFSSLIALLYFNFLDILDT